MWGPSGRWPPAGRLDQPGKEADPGSNPRLWNVATKVCSRCGLEKPLGGFYLAGGRGTGPARSLLGVFQGRSAGLVGQEPEGSGTPAGDREAVAGGRLSDAWIASRRWDPNLAGKSVEEWIERGVVLGHPPGFGHFFVPYVKDLNKLPLGTRLIGC
jgi:hypothetical protein